EGRADTRRQLPVAELRSASDDPTLFDQTLRQLADNRLVTLSGEEQAAEKKVDLAHEALISGWPQLHQWVSKRREAEQTRRRLADKAAEWVRLGSGAGGLLDVSELPEAERWLDSADAIDLGYDEALPQLVRASRIALAEEATRQRRIVRFRVAALGAIALLVIIVLGVGLWSVQRDLDNQRAFGEQQREFGQKQQEAAATSQTLAQAEATARADADARRQEAERLRLVSIAQALAVQ